MRINLKKFLIVTIAVVCAFVLSACDIDHIIDGIINPSSTTTKTKPNDNETPPDKDKNSSEGLEFTLNDDGESYYVSGIGTCKDNDIVIPSTYNGKPVTRIGSYAFSGCTSLTSITIPDSVTGIDGGTFNRCTSLKDIYYLGTLEDWCNIDFDGFYSNPCSNGSNLYINGEVLTNAIIPDTVTTIKDYAFWNCKSLTSVTIPDSVTNIGNYAFNACTSLTSVSIPNSVSSIGNWVFYYCTSLTSVTIPDSVTSIGYEAFRECILLTRVNIPDGVTSIGADAFASCISLTSVTIPNSVTSIGEGAFYWCTSLKDIYYLGTLEDWCDIDFDGSYSNPCSNGANLYINGKVLTDLAVPDTVTSMNDYAFNGCTSLTSVFMGNNVTSIGSYAFCSCTSLTSITIPDNVTSIDGCAFSGCTSLTDIYVDEKNECYKSIDGNLYTKDGKTLVWYCRGKQDTTFTIPDNVTSIADYFLIFEQTSLETIVIPSSVLNLLTSTWNGMPIRLDSPSIENIYYLGTIEEWLNISRNFSVYSAWYTGANLYINDELVEELVIPDSVTSIDYWAFYGCTSLTSVTIPDSVTSIDYWAFYGCTSLTKIHYDGTKSQWNNISKGSNWDYNTGSYTIYCTDGEISK